MNSGKKWLVAAVAMTVAGGAQAQWGGTVTGKISALNGVAATGGAPGNYDLRIQLHGQATLCAGATEPGWAYLNITDPNYKGLMAMLLTAFATGKSVTLHTNKSSSGYCQLGYLTLID